jgi:hypothetical protein
MQAHPQPCAEMTCTTARSRWGYFLFNLDRNNMALSCISVAFSVSKIAFYAIALFACFPLNPWFVFSLQAVRGASIATRYLFAVYTFIYEVALIAKVIDIYIIAKNELRILNHTERTYTLHNARCACADHSWKILDNRVVSVINTRQQNDV